MKPAVVERVPEPSKPPPQSYRSANHDEGGEDDYDDEDYDEEDEDEYDLDDALLAREVALDYHRRQTYGALGRRQDSDDEGEEGGDGEDNVMMALPSISANGQILNPTPDDIRKYIRVGRLENGNLVLAPGEAGFSDDEEDEEKKARVEQVKRQLLGQEPVGSSPAPPPPAPVSEAVRGIVENVNLPPTVATETPATARASNATSAARPSPASTPSSQPAVVEVPKKVSRFKAARMGM